MYINPFWAGVLAYLFAWGSLGVAWAIWFRVCTNKLLREHQAEWDRREKELDEAGASPREINKAADCYIYELYAQRSPYFGACFPRIKPRREEYITVEEVTE